MRLILAAAALAVCTSSASAEVWITREGVCGEWQSRWDVEQEQTGVWVGEIEHLRVGGSCTQGTGQPLRSTVRAVISDDNLFAIRQQGDAICTHFARIRDRRGSGLTVCEGAKRLPFNIQFRAQSDRSRRDPDDELLEYDRRQGRRFQDRNLDDWIGGR